MYVERGGPYYTMDAVDPWGDLAHLSKGNNKDCAPLAVEHVRRYGGVLEHPHRSKLWSAMGLPVPGGHDEFGFVIQIDQVSRGHVARKRTRLYFVGVDRSLVDATKRTGGVATHWICGSRVRKDHTAPTGGICPPGIKLCSSQQRRRTPPAFADWLVGLARSAWTFGGTDAPQG